MAIVKQFKALLIFLKFQKKSKYSN